MKKVEATVDAINTTMNVLKDAVLLRFETPRLQLGQPVDGVYWLYGVLDAVEGVFWVVVGLALLYYVLDLVRRSRRLAAGYYGDAGYRNWRFDAEWAARRRPRLRLTADERRRHSAATWLGGAAALLASLADVTRLVENAGLVVVVLALTFVDEALAVLHAAVRSVGFRSSSVTSFRTIVSTQGRSTLATLIRMLVKSPSSFPFIPFSLLIFPSFDFLFSLNKNNDQFHDFIS